MINPTKSIDVALFNLETVAGMPLLSNLQDISKTKYSDLKCQIKFHCVKFLENYN